MKDPLVVYLQDHLAGAMFGIELVQALEHDKEGTELGRLAGTWKSEIQADQEVLKEIVERAEAAPGTVKEVISWISEKAARLKLRRQTNSELGTFETLETLALGILGKKKLWQTLNTVAQSDPRFANIDFDALERRAEEQHASVERFRINFVAAVFTGRRES
jgi:hypothetical protein